MTKIEFHTGLSDPQISAAKLAQKVFAAKRNVRIAAPDPATTDALGRILWSQPADGFTPHVTLDSPLREHTRIILDHAASHEGVADVLISLCDEPLPYFARFERLFELVGKDEASRAAARTRWQFYKARGYEIVHHDRSAA